MNKEQIEKLVREAFDIEDKRDGITPNQEWREYLIENMMPLFTIFTDLIETEVNER